MCQPGRPGPIGRLPEMFAGLGRFPEREVARVVLVVAVHIHARAGLHAGHINFRKLAVRRKFRDAKIGRSVAGIGESLFGEPLDQLHHVVDVLGGPRDVFGRLEVQRAPVIEIGLNIFVGVLADAHARRRGFLDDAVVHVGEVHHLNDAKALRFQIPPQNILKNKCAEVTDVREIVDRRARRCSSAPRPARAEQTARSAPSLCCGTGSRSSWLGHRFSVLVERSWQTRHFNRRARTWQKVS